MAKYLQCKKFRTYCVIVDNVTKITTRDKEEALIVLEYWLELGKGENIYLQEIINKRYTLERKD